MPGDGRRSLAPIVLAVLISASSASSADEASAFAAPTEPLKVSVGDVSFSGNTIKLTRSVNGTFECEIDGRAEFTLGSDGDTDIAIAAQKLVISRNANAEIAVRCTGDNRSVLAGESITCQGGTFSVSGAALLKRAQ